MIPAARVAFLLPDQPTLTLSPARPAIQTLEGAVVERHDWSTAEIQSLLELPLVDLLWQAQAVHRQANPGYRVQLASLLSVKTGGCEEDCAYCPQSMHHSSDVTGRPELEVEPVLERARAARDAGAHRFCMGWAWRDIRDGAPFEAMLAARARTSTGSTSSSGRPVTSLL